jgi:glucose-1-phosphate adenylyltransferase
MILGGGTGQRLYPLTKLRAKPAVPFGGKYRLVDIPISNCINSGIEHICVLTQFNSASLHKHLQLTYRFDRFSSGFVDLLAAQQTPSNGQWYQGTADAVRQNLRRLADERFDRVLILSGDQLYRIDFRDMLSRHASSGAGITVAAMPVSGRDAGRLGLLRTDAEGRIERFVEKPQSAAARRGLAVTGPRRSAWGLTGKQPRYLASMGIYLFDRERLIAALDNDLADFGRHVIPRAIGECRVLAYPYRGYWEDVGTIRSFFEANLGLAEARPRFDFFDAAAPVYTHARALPASRVDGGRFRRAVVSDGCIIGDSSFERCVVGLRSVIAAGCDIRETVILGADYYESPAQAARQEARGLPPLGIGPGCRIRRAIIDKNARIGAGCVISPDGKPEGYDAPAYCVRDGIVIIPKGAALRAGTVL